MRSPTLDEFAVVHNIPSPYRLHLFGLLDERLRHRGLRLHVHFMAAGHADRTHWRFDARTLPFASTVWRDVGPTLYNKVGHGKAWHLNPGLLVELFRHRPRYLMVGGPWDSITGLLAAPMSRAPISIAWVEGHPRTPGRVRGLMGRVKRALLQRYNAFAVPGSDGAAYVQALLGGGRAPRILLLPNIVDESRFGDRLSAAEVGEVRRALGVPAGKRLMLWVARLIPQKGIAEFLSRLRPADLDDCRIVIVGDGPLRAMVRSTIQRENLSRHVHIISPIAYDQMPGAYAAADMLLLPSLRDNNPLCVVEALHAGLPLLLSDRVGNCREALRPGENGWRFDPTNSTAVRSAVREAVEADRATLRKMGKISRELGRQGWSSEQTIDRFLDKLPIASECVA